MMASPVLVEYAPLVVHLWPAIDMTDEQFFHFCRINRDLRIERTADGDLVIAPPPEAARAPATPRSRCSCASGPSATAAAWPSTPRPASGCPMVRSEARMPRGSSVHVW